MTDRPNVMTPFYIARMETSLFHGMRRGRGRTAPRAPRRHAAFLYGKTVLRPGVLEIVFPGHGDDGNLKQIRWPSFFKKFDDQGPALLYQEQTRRGETSRFHRLVYAPQGVLHTLHQEHQQVRKTLADMQQTTTNATKSRPRLLEKLRELLLPHMAGEEKVVYRALKHAAEGEEESATVLEGYEEHKLARRALKRLEKADPETPRWDAG